MSFGPPLTTGLSQLSCKRAHFLLHELQRTGAGQVVPASPNNSDGARLPKETCGYPFEEGTSTAEGAGKFGRCKMKHRVSLWQPSSQVSNGPKSREQVKGDSHPPRCLGSGEFRGSPDHRTDQEAAQKDRMSSPWRSTGHPAPRLRGQRCALRATTNPIIARPATSDKAALGSGTAETLDITNAELRPVFRL